MRPIRETSTGSGLPALVRGIRQIGFWLRRTVHVEHGTYGVWVLGVVVYAVWEQLHGLHDAVGPSWIGMTIHTAVFAIWTLVICAWITPFLIRRQERGVRRCFRDSSWSTKDVDGDV